MLSVQPGTTNIMPVCDGDWLEISNGCVSPKDIKPCAAQPLNNRPSSWLLRSSDTNGFRIHYRLHIINTKRFPDHRYLQQFEKGRLSFRKHPPWEGRTWRSRGSDGLKAFLTNLSIILFFNVWAGRRFSEFSPSPVPVGFRMLLYIAKNDRGWEVIYRSAKSFIMKIKRWCLRPEIQTRSLYVTCQMHLQSVIDWSIRSIPELRWQVVLKIEGSRREFFEGGGIARFKESLFFSCMRWGKAVNGLTAARSPE